MKQFTEHIFIRKGISFEVCLVSENQRTQDHEGQSNENRIPAIKRIPRKSWQHCRYRYGQWFRRVRFVNESFKASFLPMCRMADINNHFISDCTREVRIEGSRGKCTCCTPKPFSITGTVLGRAHTNLAKLLLAKALLLKANLLLAKALLLESNLLLDRASSLLPKAKAFWFVLCQ